MDVDGITDAAMGAAVAEFDNSSVWHNFTVWTAQHLGMNMSRLAPSLEDLVWAGPRMVMKLGRLGSFLPLTEVIDGFGHHRVIADPTEPGIVYATATMPLRTSTSVFTQTAPSSAAESILAAQDPNASVSRFSLEGARGLGNVFSYATSRWALSCVAMAIVFNRTNIFAATRRRVRLGWQMRLLLRFIPILLLLSQGRRILQSIQCQTSPNFAELRWANASKSSDLMFSQSNVFLHGLSATLLLGATDKQSCQSVQMVPWESESQLHLRGSLSRLWPLFVTFCYSQFVEVLSCTIQGRPPSAETGMTLFEHSLAFAEADSAVSNQLSWSLFANGTTAQSSSAPLGSTIAVTRSMILHRVNTSPEVLLVAFLSAMAHVTSHLLGLFNLQAKFRLLSTGLWALSFMGSIVWSAATFSLEDPSAQGLLRYPTVYIIGFIPHVFVLTGILLCCGIYCVALFLTALASAERDANGALLRFWDRLRRAHANMQTNVSLSDIRIRMDMDFYTALLRAGFGAITMASEAVYLNEDRRVMLTRHTWLEDERIREIESMKMQWVASGIPGSRFDTIGTIGLVPVKEGQWSATSGYAREKAAQTLPTSNGSVRRLRDGVGATERSSRWLMAMEYLMYVNRLLLTAWAISVAKLLDFVGVRNTPRWLCWMAQRPKAESKTNSSIPLRAQGDFTFQLGPGFSFAVPRVEGVDVEAELRRNIRKASSPNRRVVGTVNMDETSIDSELYDWWTRGGWWGSNDASGEYKPPAALDDPDFDATSVVSSAASEACGREQDWEPDWDGEAPSFLGDGERTPTQRSPRRSRESSPLLDTPIAPADLARLLHPHSPEERDEARALAAHLTSDRIMTRSRYRAHEQRQRAQVLLSSRQHFSAGAMSADEEATRLEQILLSRRRATATAPVGTGAAAAGPSGDVSWATGAPGLGPDGPQCVVCQSAPRTIIVWPCRCLSLCDDCRVSLAMNNFDKCVCCRREVISFSRIFVP
ncbi:hypothetical protein P8C59_000577 [Phyllachora maydis]|uniref:Ubiquitin-protein ligase n=2 Tax=Phyllachora maydis TaxID=1825666 RepID=A0AAD9HXH4_9PEZI|nr:hypothetical protein P8C59_000577 [Phyllachora maydis]